MQRTTKWILGLGALATIIIILAHGVVVPAFIWQPYVDKLNASYPEQTLTLKRVVIGLSHRPRVMVSDVSITNPKTNETVLIGLISSELDGWKSLKRRSAVIDAIAIKGLVANRISETPCNRTALACLPKSVFGMAGGLWASWSQLPGKPVLSLTQVEIENANWTTTEPKASMQWTIDDVTFKQGGDLRIGARWKSQGHESLPTELAVSVKAKSDDNDGDTLKIGTLEMNTSGVWKDFPWKAELGLDLLSIKLTRLSSGLPQLEFDTQGIRSYISREDDPSLHQAAFSSESAQGTLPGNNIAFKQAEWTFTQEHAKAWTFNMEINPQDGLIAIEPTTIEGSEGEPAQAQKRLLNCHLQTKDGALMGLIGGSTYAEANQEAREDKPFWLWHDGWFATAMELPDPPAELALCPVQ